jgi:hypothetical protein
MRQGQQAEPGLQGLVDNRGPNFEDSADVENIGGCQRIGDASIGVEQWK